MVVHKFFGSILKKDNFRRLLAGFFLLFLLSEWGSHALICNGASSHGEQSVSASEYGHEDPCQTLVLCSDGKRQDQQTSTLGHDASQHNGLLDTLSNLKPLDASVNEPSIVFSWADRLFRPPSPPFHPPKLT